MKSRPATNVRSNRRCCKRGGWEGGQREERGKMEEDERELTPHIEVKMVHVHVHCSLLQYLS